MIASALVAQAGCCASAITGSRDAGAEDGPGGPCGACTFANATALCRDGGCSMGPCDPGWGDCNAMPADGCETSLDTATDCGTCGQACLNPHGTTTCRNGICAPTCVTEFADCDGYVDNGCETNIQAYSNSCSSPEDMWAPATTGYRISGDLNADATNQYQSRSSRWFSVHVSENNNGIVSLRFQVTLTPDPTADYDLFVYRAPMCSLSTVASSTLGVGMIETTCVTWGDRWGLSDDRDYWIEVRYVGGTGCTAWTLQAIGNTGSACVSD